MNGAKGARDQRIKGSREQRIKGARDQGIKGSMEQRIKGSKDQGINGAKDQGIKGAGFAFFFHKSKKTVHKRSHFHFLRHYWVWKKYTNLLKRYRSGRRECKFVIQYMIN